MLLEVRVVPVEGLRSGFTANCTLDRHWLCPKGLRFADKVVWHRCDCPCHDDEPPEMEPTTRRMRHLEWED